jgi:hypothetical protein
LQVFAVSTHPPAPSQVEVCFSMYVLLLPVQLLPPQVLEEPGAWHVIVSVPLHTGPHSEPEPVPVHAERAPCGAPVTGLHVPTTPVTSHAAHWALQPVSQHTPSTQKPEPHSAALPQATPIDFAHLPSEPARLQR